MMRSQTKQLLEEKDEGKVSRASMEKVRARARKARKARLDALSAGGIAVQVVQGVGPNHRPDGDVLGHGMLLIEPFAWRV